MTINRIRIFEQGFSQIKGSLNNLLLTGDCRTVLLIDKDGRVITQEGELGKLDLSSFATLSAADFAATNQLASLLGEKEFSTVYHQGEKINIYFSLITGGIILVAIFDERTTLGMVRIKVRKTVNDLSQVLEGFFKKEREKPTKMPDEFAKEAEEEIEKFFE